MLMNFIYGVETWQHLFFWRCFTDGVGNMAQDLDSGEAGGMDSHQAQPMVPTKFVWNHWLTFKRVLMMVAIEITRCLAGDLLEKKLGCELSKRTVLKSHRKRKWCWGIQGNHWCEKTMLRDWKVLKRGWLGHLKIKTATFPNRYTQLTKQPYPTDQPTHHGYLSQPWSWGRTALIEIWICPGTTVELVMQKTPSLGEVKSVQISRTFFSPPEKGAVFSLALRYPIWIYPMRYLWDIIGVCTNQTRQFMFHLYTMRSLCFPSKNGGTPVEGVVLFLEWPSQAPSAIEATTRTAAFGTETKFLGETKLEDKFTWSEFGWENCRI